MKRYWTADIHFAHANIVKYCYRPTLRKSDLDDKGNWISDEIAIQAAIRADVFGIKTINGRVKPGDLVTHVGDFLNYGKNKGVEGLRKKAEDYLEQLNGTWIMIEGNHDGNNGVKTIGRHLITTIGKFRVFVSHYPTDDEHQDPDLMKYVYGHCDFAICGHVHEKWKEKLVLTPRGNSFLNINVGVDARKYIPISDSEIYNIYEKVKRNEKQNK